MTTTSIQRLAVLLVIALASPPVSRATFHLMQIEAVIGGVHGDTAAQAIQLRMRFSGQEVLGPARLVARDAAGRNPVVLIDFTASVPNAAMGARVLVASERFALYSSPLIEPDFLMLNVIPESYLATGTLTFESDDGLLAVFRVSWGGAGYTGSTSGSTENDDDGDYGEAFDGPLPHTTAQALRFRGGADAVNETSATSFGLESETTRLARNDGSSFDVVGCVDSLRDSDGDGQCDNTPPPVEPDPQPEVPAGDDLPSAGACGDCGAGAPLAMVFGSLLLLAMRLLQS